MNRKSISSIRFENMAVALPGHDGGRAKRVFENVTCELPMNKVVWLKGQSGGGKSVLVKVLNGLVPLSEGHYYINDEDVAHMSFEEFKPYRLNIGYSFDFGGLINNRSIEANLALPLDYHDAKHATENKKQVDYYLDYFGLKDFAGQRPSAIVGGLRKAACLARAFVHEPEMLLLDDPTTGLRAGLIDRMRDLIKAKMKSGVLKHVFVATEDERLVTGLDATVIEVREGALWEAA